MTHIDSRFEFCIALFVLYPNELFDHRIIGRESMVKRNCMSVDMYVVPTLDAIFSVQGPY